MTVCSLFNSLTAALCLVSVNYCDVRLQHFICQYQFYILWKTCCFYGAVHVLFFYTIGNSGIVLLSPHAHPNVHLKLKVEIGSVFFLVGKLQLKVCSAHKNSFGYEKVQDYKIQQLKSGFENICFIHMNSWMWRWSTFHTYKSYIMEQVASSALGSIVVRFL